MNWYIKANQIQKGAQTKSLHASSAAQRGISRFAPPQLPHDVTIDPDPHWLVNAALNSDMDEGLRALHDGQHTYWWEAARALHHEKAPDLGLDPHKHQSLGIGKDPETGRLYLAGDDMKPVSTQFFLAHVPNGQSIVQAVEAHNAKTHENRAEKR